MRPIRGPRHASDDERTVEAPPDEPTMSAGVDVRAAFEAEDKTVPDAVAGLGPIDGAPHAGEQTLPLVSPAVVREIRASSKDASEPRQPAGAPPPPPSSQPRPRTAAMSFPLPPPSDPVIVSTQRGSDADDDEQPIEIPGVGAAQRKRMLRIVFGVLGVCGLLCVAAAAQQLISGNASGSKTSTTATATAPAASGAETATATATATASAGATARAVAASAEPPAPPPTAAATATATPEPPAPPPPPPPPPTAVVATPIARAAAPDPQPAAPPAPRRQAAPAAPPPPPPSRPRQAAPPAGKSKPSIVRDAPF